MIRNAIVLEVMKKINTMVFDKTGTLTNGKPEVTEIKGIKMSEGEVLVIAASIEKSSEHPLADAIVKKAEGKKPLILPAEGVRDSIRSGLFSSKSSLPANEQFRQLPG